MRSSRAESPNTRTSSSTDLRCRTRNPLTVAGPTRPVAPLPVTGGPLGSKVGAYPSKKVRRLFRGRLQSRPACVILRKVTPPSPTQCKKVVDSKRFVDGGSKWRGTVLAVLPGLALAGPVGCNKTSPKTDSAFAVDAEPVGIAVPETEADAATEVKPPSPVVAADPNIPLHEAVVGAAPVPADYSAIVAPPGPVVEDEPPRPEPDETWIPGYWWWSGPLDRYVWVSGAWRRAPPDQVWFAGSWIPGDGRFMWSPGYWGPNGYARVMIDIAPPPLPFEAYGDSPGVGFVWTPGYYGYRGGSYVLVAGSWLRPPVAGLAWIEPRYVGIGSRYYLQPGRWDFAPERRGTVYRPDIDVRAGARVHFTPVHQSVVSAHARYVSACAHGIARGATRAPNGVYVLPHAGGNPLHGSGVQGGAETHFGAGPKESEPHGGPGPKVNEHREELHRGPAPAPQRGAAAIGAHPGPPPPHERPPEKRR